MFQHKVFDFDQTRIPRFFCQSCVFFNKKKTPVGGGLQGAWEKNGNIYLALTFAQIQMPIFWVKLYYYKSSGAQTHAPHRKKGNLRR